MSYVGVFKKNKRKTMFQKENIAYSKPKLELCMIGGLLNVPKWKLKQGWMLRNNRYCLCGHWNVYENSQCGGKTFAQHITVFTFCASVLQNIFLFSSFLF